MGFFFPCQVAVWRFIEQVRPGVLGPLNARFAGEPLFFGKGAQWFCHELGANETYIERLEAIMCPITRSASAQVREAVVRRGGFRDEEIPPIDEEVVRHLADVVLRAVDEGVAVGRTT